MPRPCGVALLLLALACSRTPRPAAPAPAVRANAPSPAPGHGPAAAASVLEKVRPPPPPCLPAAPYAAPSTLATRASEAVEEGDAEKALACAEEAIRLAPRLVRALAARASALAALERIDDARLAFARALAVDPDDADALTGAADLYVRRLGGDHDALETGLEYAVRGLRTAERRPRRKADLVGRLELVAGMAENDLGRSQRALPHLDRAVAALPDDPEAVYERGLSLYELCRFDDARKAFERALALSPDDPWTLHQLGLIAERKGDAAHAETLLGKARALDPADFPADLHVEAAAFEAEVGAAVAALPEQERKALGAVPVEVQELPDESDLLAVDPPLSPSILGLFRGPSDDEPCLASDGPRCRTIVFYRRNLLRFARDRRELSEQIRVTLLHELGHLHGESEDELRARGLE